MLTDPERRTEKKRRDDTIDEKDQPRYVISVAAQILGVHPQTSTPVRARGPDRTEAHWRENKALLRA